ncbi:MAG: phosphocarrier protein HPr [Gammaproteobacteria bacterium]|nr:MAG: phosphocarrier protein HPr [Gammaproteobacteria bacterium]
MTSQLKTNLSNTSLLKTPLLKTSVSCEVVNIKGLHARAAARIVTTANQFDSTVTVTHKENIAPANSLIKLLTLNAPKGSVLVFDSEGDDCMQVSEALKILVTSGFDE